MFDLVIAPICSYRQMTKTFLSANYQREVKLYERSGARLLTIVLFTISCWSLSIAAVKAQIAYDCSIIPSINIINRSLFTCVGYAIISNAYNWPNLIKNTTIYGAVNNSLVNRLTEEIYALMKSAYSIKYSKTDNPSLTEYGKHDAALRFERINDQGSVFSSYCLFRFHKSLTIFLYFNPLLAS